MTSPSQMVVDKIDDVTIVRLCKPRITDALEIEGLGKELYDALEDKSLSKLIVNFSIVEFLSSSTLGKLLSLNAKMRARNGQLRLCCIRPQILEVFLICCLDRILDIQPDEAAALASLR